VTWYMLKFSFSRVTKIQCGVFYNHVIPKLKSEYIFKEIFDAMGKEPSAKKIYAYFGNSIFLGEKQEDCRTNDFNQTSNIESIIKSSEEQCFDSQNLTKPYYHSVKHYEECLLRWSGLKAFDTKTVFYIQGTEFSEPRVVKQCKRFEPEVKGAELIRVKSDDGKPDQLRLQLKGHNLFQIVLEKCNFNFGFPFSKTQDRCQVRR
jgi:hypothetical protein